MKRITIILSFIFVLSFNAYAQDLCPYQKSYTQTDGFFSEDPFTPRYKDVTQYYTPTLPERGYNVCQEAEPAPVGSGLLILLSMGAGYMIYKKKKD